MKRINNKYRSNNGNNQIYSLNYKFDSSSIAGKCSGTALDLIKRYNELAKDAASNNDYVSAEVFRQYAEHYRKIVTEINEKKNQNRQINVNNNQQSENTEITDAGQDSTVAQIQNNEPQETTSAPVEEPATERKAFTVVEIPQTEAESAVDTTDTTQEPVRKVKRVYRRRQAVAE